MKRQNTYFPFRKLHEHLTQTCQQLGWKLEENLDILNRFDIETGYGFSIDGIEYFVSEVTEPSPLKTLKPLVGYHAFGVVQNHGNFYEPPSEDYAQLKGEQAFRPENLVGRILQNHFSIRLQWCMESLIPEYDPAESFE